MEAHWQESWTQEGTRKENERQVNRMLCRFTEKSHAARIEGPEVRLPKEIEELK